MTKQETIAFSQSKTNSQGISVRFTYDIGGVAELHLQIVQEVLAEGADGLALRLSNEHALYGQHAVDVTRRVVVHDADCTRFRDGDANQLQVLHILVIFYFF